MLNRGNPRRAKLVEAAEDWSYSSLYAGQHRPEDQVQLTPWPIPRPADRAKKVNEPLAEAELNRLRLHLQRSRPYGEAAWVAAAAQRMGLEWRRSAPRPPA